MKRRLALFIALLGIIGGTIATGVAFASPAVEIGDNLGSHSQCLNRQGGGTTMGTTVIGWSCGDNNNDFEFQDTFYKPCNSQTVTPTCPFTDTSLDRQWDGAPIVQVEEYDHGWCVGTAGATLSTYRLEGCADQNGENGGWNGIMVALGQPSNVFGCVITVHMTNAHPGEIWGMVDNGHGNAITTATGTNPGNCGNAALWKELFNL